MLDHGAQCQVLPHPSHVIIELRWETVRTGPVEGLLPWGSSTVSYILIPGGGGGLESGDFGILLSQHRKSRGTVESIPKEKKKISTVSKSIQ